MDERELIGRGRTADVYAWSPDEVVKLYHPWWPLRSIRYEAEIGRAVHAAGLPSPSIGDIVEVEGRYGLVFQRLPAKSLEDMMWAEPQRLDELASTFAQLHATLHGKDASGFPCKLPSTTGRLRYAIEAAAPEVLPAHLRSSVPAVLDALPEGDRLLHGDFHPGNILVSGGQSYIIDWENLSTGNPSADVARTSLLFEIAHLSQPELSGPEVREIVAHFLEVYVQEYCRATGAEPRDIEAWRLPVAAARLHEEIQGEAAYLLAMLQ